VSPILASVSPLAAVMEERPPRIRQVALLLALASVLRAAVLWTAWDDLDRDIDGYRELAVNLRQAGVFGWTDPHVSSRVRATAFRPPLYPLVLSLFVVDGQLSPASVAILHLTVGVATIVLAHAVAVRCGLGRWSVLAAAFVAVDPILLNQSSRVMTETLATFFAAASLYVLAYRHDDRSPVNCVGIGVVLGLSVLCRPTFLPWLVLCVGDVWIAGRTARRRAVHSAAFLAGVAMVLVPWVARNYARFGHVKATTTHGGYTLLLGNNPSFYRFLSTGPWGSVWNSEELDRAWQQRHLVPDAHDPRWSDLALARLTLPARSPATVRDGEFADDRFAYALARRYMRDRPGMFGWACLVRLGRFWGVWPHAVTASESSARRAFRYLVAVWYLVVWVLALTGAGAQGWALVRNPWRSGVWLCLAFTAVHVFYWTDLRMRAPLTPFLAILAAAGAARVAWQASRR